jgi:hypothetical protein
MMKALAKKFLPRSDHHMQELRELLHRVGDL